MIKSINTAGKNALKSKKVAKVKSDLMTINEDTYIALQSRTILYSQLSPCGQPRYNGHPNNTDSS